MKIRGRAWKFGDNISTDHIIPGRYYHLRSNLEELPKHAMEDLVAGENFGMGSSREHAALVLKIVGVSAVVARSFARIFYRNSINVGLPVIMADTSKIKTGDELEIDFEGGLIRNLTSGMELPSRPLPEIMLKILREGGLVEYVKKYGDLEF